MQECPRVPQIPVKIYLIAKDMGPFGGGGSPRTTEYIPNISRIAQIRIVINSAKTRY